MQDKDFDIIIIKSERQHMVRKRSREENNHIESLLVNRKHMKRSFFSQKN